MEKRAEEAARYDWRVREEKCLEIGRRALKERKSRRRLDTKDR